MKIAVTHENGCVFAHFGHTKQFKIYEVEEGKIISSQIVDTEGSGHGALASFLSERGVEVLICGGIGGGAQLALADEDIMLRGGVSGDCDEAVLAFIKGNLAYDPEARCNHHHEGHDAEHHCHSHTDHHCHSHSDHHCHH